MGPQIWKVKKCENHSPQFAPTNYLCKTTCTGKMPEESHLLETGDEGFPEGSRHLYCRRLRKRLSLCGRKQDSSQPHVSKVSLCRDLTTSPSAVVLWLPKSSWVFHLAFLFIINPQTGLLSTGINAISISSVMSQSALGHYVPRVRNQ